MKNGVMMQFFEWYLNKGMLWKKLKEEAPKLAELGITAIWIPPFCKGSGGSDDVGYGVYDLYDLGEFDQKGSIPTKYGTKQELIEAIQACHTVNIQVYADIVLDHLLGGDEVESIWADKYDSNNRNVLIEANREITAWTHFYYPERNKMYSDFEWHWNHFDAVDWDESTQESGIFKFHGKSWDKDVDQEKGNYDYLMGANIDLDNQQVVQELMKWGKWVVEETDIDGFRMDAVKHMRFSFYNDWLAFLRAGTKEELFSVGEYWNGDINALKNYIDTNEGALSLFDVPLHYRFFDISKSNGTFDMRQILDDTLLKDNPLSAVTFVDNHDTQPNQALESWVDDWFKPAAYAFILLRAEGYPCIFYGDYYGIEKDGIVGKREYLDKLLEARKNIAYGKQNDYLDDPHIIGWTREGDITSNNFGLAVLISNQTAGEKEMYLGKEKANQVYIDLLGNREEEIVIDSNGNGVFKVADGSVSVWIKKN